MIDLATFGETMGTVRFQDFPTAATNTRSSHAGAESNVAIGLARLGHQVSWIGSLGADTYGELILRSLLAENVDVGGVRRLTDRATGLLVSRPAGMGAFSVDYHRTESAGRQFSAEQIDYLFSLKPRIVHLTGITPALGEVARQATVTVAERAREAGIPVSFDVNFRSRLWAAREAQPVLAQIAGAASIVCGGPEELELLTGESDVSAGVEALLAAGVQTVVTKDSGSATAYSANSTTTRASNNVTVRDTIGAGDAFVAGFLSGVLDGADPGTCLERGHLCGAFAVGSIGDWEGAPTREALAAANIGSGEVLR